MPPTSPPRTGPMTRATFPADESPRIGSCCRIRPPNTPLHAQTAWRGPGAWAQHVVSDRQQHRRQRATPDQATGVRSAADLIRSLGPDITQPAWLGKPCSPGQRHAAGPAAAQSAGRRLPRRRDLALLTSSVARHPRLRKCLFCKGNLGWPATTESAVAIGRPDLGLPRRSFGASPRTAVTGCTPRLPPRSRSRR